MIIELTLENAKDTEIEILPHITQINLEGYSKCSGRFNLLQLVHAAQNILDNINGPTESLWCHEEIETRLNKVFRQC